VPSALETTEQELLLRAQKNDIEAFESLISPYTNQLLNHAFRILKNREDAEDALQDTYLKTYNSIKKFEGVSSFKTWLYKILTNACLDKLRKQKRETTTSLYTTDEDGEHEINVADETYSPEISAQKSAAYAALKKALDTLSEEHRIAIIMRDIDGLTYDEIAEATETNVGTVKSRINRARSQLKKILQKDRELFV